MAIYIFSIRMRLFLMVYCFRSKDLRIFYAIILFWITELDDRRIEKKWCHHLKGIIVEK